MNQPALPDDCLDCLVVGAGPAGLTAATYLARFRRHVLVADAGASRARWIPASHNCPGFPFGVAGNELLARFRLQAEAYGVPQVRTRIRRLSRYAGHFEATDGERTWAARTVILATGVVDRLPVLEGVEQAIHHGLVRLCAICDGYEARDESIAVLAPAGVAVGHAAFLRTFSRTVYAIDAGEAAPDRDTADRARAAGVEMLPAPERLWIEDGACHARFPDGREQCFDTLYPVLGADVQSDLAAALGARCDAQGYVLVDERMQTCVEGLYAIGDVASELNQISVAVGHAALAATTVHRRLAPNYR